jgi:hypothetical protein
MSLGSQTAMHVGDHAVLGADLFAMRTQIREADAVVDDGIPEPESQHHIYLLDLGNVEAQLQTLIEETRGLRADLASRTLSAHWQRFWAVVKGWVARLRDR